MTRYPAYRDHGDRPREYLLDVAASATSPSPSGVTPSSCVLCADCVLLEDVCRDYLLIEGQYRAALERLEDRAVQQGLDSACAEAITDPVERLDRAEIQSRADAVARDLLHASREDAFGRLQRGELSGTLAEPELRMLRDLLGNTRGAGRSCEAVTRDLRAPSPSPEEIDRARDPRDHLIDFPYASTSTTELLAYLDAQRELSVREPDTFARQTAMLRAAQVQRELAIRNRRAMEAMLAEDCARIDALRAALREAGVRDPTCPLEHLGACMHAPLDNTGDQYG